MWSPAASPESDTGLVQSTKGPPSMLHASAAEGSSAVNASDADVALNAMRGGVRSDVMASGRAAVLVLPEPSLALPAASSTVTMPSPGGVTVNVYAAPEPWRFDAVPLSTLMPASPKPVTGSVNVALTANDAAFVGFAAVVESATPGRVAS